MFTAMVQAILDRIVDRSDEIAFLNEEGTCNFGDLGGRCQGIMDAIGDARDGVVLIYGHKERDVVAAMLACVLTGRPFVFVDVANPLQRIIQIAKIADTKLVISARDLPGKVAGPFFDGRSIESRPLAIRRFEVADPERLFYIAFTSGSTGVPVGVRIGCDNFGHFYNWYGRLLREWYGRDAHVNHASLSFDMGMMDLWPSFAVGKSVILLDHRYNATPRANLRLMKGSATITPGSWCSTPTFLEMMCADPTFEKSNLPRLRAFFVGGEPVQRALVSKMMKRFPDAEVWHGYGPTEVTCITHCHRLTPLDLLGSQPLSLGRVVPPNEIRVIDGIGRQVPTGQCGEIELAGPQVAHGYLPENHPRKSAFGDRGDKSFYRTGDTGILDRDGTLRLSGRLDGQLKWNGNRIETTEIERVAHEATGVVQAVLVPLFRDGRVIDLVLFVQLHHDGSAERSSFVNHLIESLPHYMKPRSIRFLDCLPMNLHGKVDRPRLAWEAANPTSSVE